MGSTHGIRSIGSTRRKHTKRYIPARKQKRGRKRGHNELSESWDSPSKLGLKAKVKSIIRGIRTSTNEGGKWARPSPIQAVLHNVRVGWDRGIYQRGVTHRAKADQDTSASKSRAESRVRAPKDPPVRESLSLPYSKLS
jgi:hypothetical protein